MRRQQGTKFTWFLLTVIVLLAIGVRFISLDRIPASLYYDEIDLGYQVKSLLTTGHDYRGDLSPFYFRSLNTDKTPLPILFSTLPSLIFSSSAYQVRAGAAIAGVFSVVLVMILTFQITKSIFTAAITGIVFAFSPWQIQFSRIAFEAIFMQMFCLVSLVVFFYWQKTKKVWVFYLMALFLGLNVYTYRPMSLLAPILVLLLLFFNFGDFFRQGYKRITLWLLIVGATMIPFLYATTITSSDQPRINQISIFSNPKIPIEIQRNRELDSNDYVNPQIGKQAIFSSFVFHNKVVSNVTDFSHNYIRTFSPEFLFLTGDPNHRHTPKNTGPLLLVDIFGLITGLFLVIKNIKDKKHQILLALLLLSPIPSDLTVDGANHASRLIVFSTCLLIIVGLGYSSWLKWLFYRKRYRPAIPIVLVIWATAFIFYLHQYFVHYPVEGAREFGYGYRQAFEKINQLKDQYQAIRLTSSSDQPMLYYFYWSNIPPVELQKYGTEFGEEIVKNQPLDKVKPIRFEDELCQSQEISKLKPDVLYLVNNGNLPLDLRYPDRDQVPDGIKLVDVIKYPDNEVAFYLITRDSQNGKDVQPEKENYCKI